MISLIGKRRAAACLVRGLLLSSLFLIGLSSPARADTYTYTGNSFGYDGYCDWEWCGEIYGSFMVPSLLAPSTAYNLATTPPPGFTYLFEDGIFGYWTPYTTFDVSAFTIDTNASGNISEWNIDLVEYDPFYGYIEMQTVNMPGDVTDWSYYYDFFGIGGENSDDPGTWSVPEPGSLLLLGTGLLGIVGAARRKWLS